MSSCYLRESAVESSFLSAFSAYTFDNKKYFNDLFYLDYLPLKNSFILLNNISNNYYNPINSYQQILPNDDYFFNNLSLDEGAIALFPLFLYCYRDNHNLEEILEQIKNNYLSSNTNINSWKILIIVINLILEKQIKNTNISQQIINSLEEYEEEEIKEIKLIDTLISEKVYLTQAEEIFPKNIEQNSLGIYQSIYNFFCLPDNPKVTLLRSQKFTNSQESTRILTGFLLGLHNNNYPFFSSKKIQFQGEYLDKIIKKFLHQWRGIRNN